MTKIISIGLAIAIVAIFHATDVILAAELSHPFWHNRATLVGAGFGVLLAIALLWLQNRIVTGLTVIGFLVSILTVWRAAAVFINSADYEPLAGRIWFFGYHATIALFVALAAVGIYSILERRPPATT